MALKGEEGEFPAEMIEDCAAAAHRAFPAERRGQIAWRNLSDTHRDAYRAIAQGVLEEARRWQG